MSCLRCGRDTEENQVFCRLCLKEMEKYPVKPGTAVQIPIYPVETENRKSKAKPPTLEETYQKLRHTYRILLVVLAGVIILFGLTLGMLISTRNRMQKMTTPPLQNFNTTQTTTTDSD